jgi:predicted small lipoprotein YifL
MRICWAQYALWAVIAAFGVLALLSGCGAKGDLFLPPEPQAAEQAPVSEVQADTAPPAEAPADEAEAAAPTEPQTPPTQDQ